MINPPLASTAIGVVHYSRSGMASGINSTFRQVGIVTGIAGLGAIFAHEVSHTVNSKLAASGQGQAVQSAAHGHLSTLLQSGEVGKVLHALPPSPRPPWSTPTASASPKPSPRSSRSPPPSRSPARCAPSCWCAAATSSAPPSRPPRPRRLPRASRWRRGRGRPGSAPGHAVHGHPGARTPAVEHRQTGVARVRWVLARAVAQREDRATRVGHHALEGAAVAQPGRGCRRDAVDAVTEDMDAA